MRSTKYQLGTWKLSQHLIEDTGKPRKPMSRWPVAGPSGCILTPSQQSGKRKNRGDPQRSPNIRTCCCFVDNMDYKSRITV
jgi:hypothetical protein